ncbi:MAG: N-acetylmuramoyl-L-alanine amidase [Chitinispirillaceae bacterium]|nr:N-acetylmuramoyl-L-alanine amidase [Chitinispirillaceae bacterium]
MGRKIHDLLLQSSNSKRCGNDTIGDLVAATGKKRLWSDRAGDVVDVIVIHYISAVERFPDDPFCLDHVIPLFAEYGASSHYLITRRGAVYRLVPDQFKAWHCGGSIMPQPDGRRNVNEFSIGIELLATDTSGFTPTQYRLLGMLCHTIEQSRGVLMTYVGHEQVAGTGAVEMGLRSDCKVDPGLLFDWKRFFRDLGRYRRNAADKLQK